MAGVSSSISSTSRAGAVPAVIDGIINAPMAIIHGISDLLITGAGGRGSSAGTDGERD